MKILPMLGVEKVILTGDMITEDYAPDSRIELIVVQNTELLLRPPSRLLSLTT